MKPRVSLDFLQGFRMNIEEGVLMVTFVQGQSSQKLTKVSLIATSLRSHTVHVNGNFHECDRARNRPCLLAMIFKMTSTQYTKRKTSKSKAGASRVKSSSIHAPH